MGKGVGEGRKVSAEGYEKAVGLVGKIRSTVFSDEEIAEFEDELNRLIPHPAWPDLMFWHDPELSDKEVVEEGLRYRPIAL